MFSFDRKYLYIILAIFVAISIGQYLSNPSALLGLLLTLPGVLIAITFHEFAHAWMAVKFGDDTPKIQGRLTLNPLAHLDPIGTFMLIFAHFGWGKPVEIDPRNFNQNKKMSTQEALVAVAGPAMNIILAFVFTVIDCLILKLNPSFLYTTWGSIICLFIECTIIVNVSLGVFNLIPLPPLDGSKILMNFLPYNARNWLKANQYIFRIIFMILWITNILSYIISPVITVVYSGIYSLVLAILSLFGI